MPEHPSGSVHLVGTGPGDPGLLTARALELIGQADVILHDRLIPPGVLEAARADAELRYVGKDGSGRDRSVPQDQTESLMIDYARAGKLVVRLKGGDPYVFGRGGEEGRTLLAAGIDFTVVPGITSGIAAAAYAGIPVTYRGLSSAVALITAHEDPDKPEQALDWQTLSDFPGTLVLYMGVRSLRAASAALLAAGRPGTQPAAVVEYGTLPWQRSVRATLATIADVVQEHDLRSPAVTIFGEVVALADELDWFGRSARPLAGRSVVVTRARAQASGLAQRLQSLGARVIQAPAIRINKLPVRPPDLSAYDLICITSANGATALMAGLRATGRDARALAGCTIAAIGPGTADALSEQGIVADLLPQRSVAEGLLEALQEASSTAGQNFKRVLIARAKQARDVLPDGLQAMGMTVDPLDLYETVAEPIAADQVDEILGSDYITFTSGSTVRHFFAALGPAAKAQSPASMPKLVSIGPITSASLKDLGHPPDVEAAEHDIDGLLAALVKSAQGS